MLTLSEVLAAAQRIAPHIHRTPVLTSQGLDALLGKALFFKAEHLQKTGSFKARGALNTALQLPTPKGLITVSSGNHAQGVAYAARVLQGAGPGGHAGRRLGHQKGRHPGLRG